MNTHTSSLVLSARMLGVLVLGAAISGCSTSSRFSVEAQRVPGAPVSGSSYRLVPGPAMAASAPANVSTGWVLRDVATALSAHGLHLVTTDALPALEIEVDIALDAPVLETLTHTVPVYAQPAPQSSANGRLGGAGGASGPRKIGEQQVARTVQVHPKRLHLTAWPVLPDGSRSDRPVWSVQVNNADESSDLAAYARLMVAAAMDWIGRATDQPQVIALHARDSRVTFIARGLSPSSGNVALADPNPAAGNPRAGG